MSEAELLYLSAQRAAAMTGHRQLSPVELTEVVRNQTARIAPLNAFVRVLWDGARSAARAAEAAGAHVEDVTEPIDRIEFPGRILFPGNFHVAMQRHPGFATDGLPTSVEIVGGWGADMDVLRLGALREEAAPWSGKRPPIPR